MAFEGLSEKLNSVFKGLRGKGRLTEEDIKLAMREVRMALLEADVSYKVVKDFVARVSERAVGAEVLDSLLPQAFVRPARLDAYLDPQHGWLVLDTASRKAAELALAALREALGSFPAQPLAATETPRALLTRTAGLERNTAIPRAESTLRELSICRRRAWTPFPPTRSQLP